MFLLVKCRRCGAYMIGSGTARTARCPSCSLVNPLHKVVRVKAFPTREEAIDALRLVKIPKALRDRVPWAAATGAGSKANRLECARAFLSSRAGPATEEELLAAARAEGLDVEAVQRLLAEGKAEGTILEGPGGKLRI